MGTLVAFEWMSLDGVYDADSMPEWFFPYDSLERRKAILATYRQADALLMGRTTYEMLAPYWSPLPDDEQDGLAGMLTHTPKYVASDRPAIARWGTTTTFNGNTISEVEKIKSKFGTVVLIGSGKLAGTLAKAGLIDEYRLLVQPFVMGTGERFFAEAMNAPMQLIQAQELDQGQVLLRYRVQKIA